jgi:hypothetical protein
VTGLGTDSLIYTSAATIGAALDDRWVNITGDTMTGPLYFTNAGQAFEINGNGSPDPNQNSQHRYINTGDGTIISVRAAVATMQYLDGAYQYKIGLEVGNGRVWAANAGILTSDAATKTNVHPLSEQPVAFGASEPTWAQGVIKSLTPVSFQRTEQYRSEGDPNAVQYGFIAQDVEAVFPDAVKDQTVTIGLDESNHSINREVKGLIPDYIYAVTVQALQDALGRIGALETRLAALEALQ